MCIRDRFVYIHTFFRRKIMCGCRLAIYLYGIRCASYARRLHHSHIAPFEPIWAEITSTIDKIYLWAIRAVMLVLSRPVCLHNSAAFIYRNILLGENLHSLIHTRTWENSCRFFRAELLYILYIVGKNVKIVRSHTRENFLPRFLLHLNEVRKDQLLELAWTNQILYLGKVCQKVVNCTDCIKITVHL